MQSHKKYDKQQNEGDIFIDRYPFGERLLTVGKTYGAKGLNLRAGVWEGLVNASHTADAPLLICSPVTFLRKQCNEQTSLAY